MQHLRPFVLGIILGAGVLLISLMAILMGGLASWLISLVGVVVLAFLGIRLLIRSTQ